MSGWGEGEVESREVLKQWGEWRCGKVRGRQKRLKESEGQDKVN